MVRDGSKRGLGVDVGLLPSRCASSLTIGWLVPGMACKAASATTSPRVLGYDCHTTKLSDLFMAQLQPCEFECVAVPELSATKGARIACRGDPIAAATGDLTTRAHTKRLRSNSSVYSACASASSLATGANPCRW